jgi:hypothetical protein
MPEEPDERIAHVRICGGAGWVTTGSTRKYTEEGRELEEGRIAKDAKATKGEAGVAPEDETRDRG